MPHADLRERRVFYEEHGSGDPVLLVGGLGADHTAWALQTEYLRERFRVIVVDNPGVGRTEGAPFWEIPDAFYRLNRELLEAH